MHAFASGLCVCVHMLAVVCCLWSSPLHLCRALYFFYAGMHCRPSLLVAWAMSTAFGLCLSNTRLLVTLHTPHAESTQAARKEIGSAVKALQSVGRAVGRHLLLPSDATGQCHNYLCFYCWQACKYMGHYDPYMSLLVALCMACALISLIPWRYWYSLSEAGRRTAGCFA